MHLNTRILLQIFEKADTGIYIYIYIYIHGPKHVCVEIWERETWAKKSRQRSCGAVNRMASAQVLTVYERCSNMPLLQSVHDWVLLLPTFLACWKTLDVLRVTVPVASMSFHISSCLLRPWDGRCSSCSLNKCKSAGVRSERGSHSTASCERWTPKHQTVL
jgi:hypothetical protein